MTIRHSGATKLSHGEPYTGVARKDNVHDTGTLIAESCVMTAMTRQWKGAALAVAFVTAFLLSIAFHSIVAAVIVLLCGITVAYVMGIAWMRTSTHRERGKQQG